MEQPSCAVCYRPLRRNFRCPDCRDEFYCGVKHRDKHRLAHQRVCAARPRTDAAPRAQPRAGPRREPRSQQASPLLRLPPELQLAVLRHLGPRDLVRLGHVSRALRALVQDACAWRHAVYPDPAEDRWYRSTHDRGDFDDLAQCSGVGDPPRMLRHLRYTTPTCGVLRVAPALHTLRVLDRWPPVNLLRFTKAVTVLDLDLSLWNHGYNSDKVARLLEHYRGHLQVVKLCTLTEVALLRAIDSLNVRELYVAGSLVRTYPGSSKVLTSLTVGSEVSEAVLVELLGAAQATLRSFKVKAGSDYEHNYWGYNRSSLVPAALKNCTQLEEVSVPTWRGAHLALADAFPKLRALCLHDFGLSHKLFADMLATSPAMRRLDTLALRLRFGHRGLLQAVPRGCLNLRTLCLSLESSPHVELCRDLLIILGALGDLQKLIISNGRVPSAFFAGLAEGGLPNLEVLELRHCGVTALGRQRLEALPQRRPDLQLLQLEVSSPKPNPTYRGCVLCANRMCREDGVGEDLEADDVPGWQRSQSVSWGSRDSLDFLDRDESDSDTGSGRSGSSIYSF